jgi:hypothetical protein
MTTTEWETTSFFAFSKRWIVRDLPLFSVLGAILVLGNYFAQVVLDEATYSALAANVDVGMTRLTVCVLGLMTLLSSMLIPVAVFERTYMRRPWPFIARIAATSIFATTAFGWTFIHTLRGDLGEVLAKLISLFLA